MKALTSFPEETSCCLCKMQCLWAGLCPAYAVLPTVSLQSHHATLAHLGNSSAQVKPGGRDFLSEPLQDHRCHQDWDITPVMGHRERGAVLQIRRVPKCWVETGGPAIHLLMKSPPCQPLHNEGRTSEGKKYLVAAPIQTKEKKGGEKGELLLSKAGFLFNSWIFIFMYVQNWEHSRGKNGVVEPRKALQCPKYFSTPLFQDALCLLWQGKETSRAAASQGSKGQGTASWTNTSCREVQ